MTENEQTSAQMDTDQVINNEEESEAKQTKVPDANEFFPALAKIDWREKLHEQNRKPAFVDAIQMVFLAENSGKMSFEEVVKDLQEVTQNALRVDTFDFTQEEQEYLALSPESQEGYPKYRYEKRKKALEELKTHAEKMSTDIEYTKKWWEAVKLRLNTACEQVVESAQKNTDPRLSDLFGPYVATGQSRVPIAERTYPLLMLQYLELSKLKYPGNAVDFAYFSAGFATNPELGKNRGIVLKIEISLDNSFEKPDNDFPIMVYPQAQFAMIFGLHEGIHIWGDGMHPQELIDTGEGPRVKEHRGFYIAYYEESGDADNRLNGKQQQELPHQAIDEGTVVLLDAYVTNSKSLVGIDLKIDGQAQINSSYKEAAKVTAKIAEVVGMEILLRHYVQSDIEGWLESVTQKLGIDGLTSYLETMKILQSGMSVFQK